MATVSDTKDILMLLLYAQGHQGKQAEPIVGRTRLMKMVFLFQKEVRQKLKSSKGLSAIVLPEFEAYDFGPFSSQVYSDLEFLVDAGFVAARQIGESTLSEPEQEEYQHWTLSRPDRAEDAPVFEEEFRLTSIGKEFVDAGEAGNLTPDQWDVLNRFKARCTSASLRAILQYVYTKYESMTKNSKIKDDILNS